MNKCPYCGHMNNDNATTCERCYAGLPHEEKQKDKSENGEIRVSRKRVRS